MTKITRTLDSAVVGEESTIGTEASTLAINLLGDIVNCTMTVDEDEKVLNGMTGGTTGHLPTKIVDLKVTPTGAITFHPGDLKFFKYVISDYNEAAGEYTLANRSTALPTSLSIKGNIDNSKGLLSLGSYLTNIRFGLTDEDILTVTANIVSLFVTTDTGVVTYSPPSPQPLVYHDGVFTIDGNEWDLQNINFTYDPKFGHKFGITSKATNKKRFPTEIIRLGKASISFDGVANIVDGENEIEVGWGGVSAQDVKSNIDLVLTFTDDSSKSHAITLTGKTNKAEILQSDSEENSKTLVFAGVGVDFTIVGDL